MGVIKWVGFVLLSGLVGIVIYQVPICNGDSGSKSLKKLTLSRDHIDETLRRAGSQAYRDVAKSVPLMLVMTVLARAFPFFSESQPWLGGGGHDDDRGDCRHGGDRQPILIESRP